LRPNFGGSAVERGDRTFAVALLVAGVTASVVVTGILVALRPNPAAPRPAAPSALVALPPVALPPVTSLSTPVPVITSTVSGAGPLALFWTSSAPDGSVTLTARTYAGNPAGTLVLPSSPSGFEIAPNGMKVLNGNQIVAVSGAVLGSVPEQFFQATLPPMWADDSTHLCEVSTPTNGAATGTLIEFDDTGHARIVATLGSIASTNGGWGVLACSPNANRAVVLKDDGQTATLIVLQLSTGRVLAEHSAGDVAAIASHDGSIVALDEPSGITIRNSMTWAILGRVVRWGSQAGYPLIGAVVGISWDGSRIIVDGGGAGGGEHPEWMVDWETDRTLLTNTGTEHPAVGFVNFDDAIALTTHTGFFLPPGDVSAVPGDAYILQANGGLERLAG
jgi:hypothetical protein